jgi:FkbM family methyltransferase
MIKNIYWFFKLFYLKIIGKLPSFSTDILLFTENYGTVNCNWTIAKNTLNKNSIVYSFGVGKDISFDISIINKYSCKIYAFDPILESKNFILSYKNLPKSFIFYNYGISDCNHFDKIYIPSNPNHISHSKVPTKTNFNKSIIVEFKTLSTIMLSLNHTKIDLLKLDIEGYEYDVIDNLINENIDINQILIEFHHYMYLGLNLKKTNYAIERLKNNGYKLFYISKNRREYSFIKI